MNDDLPLISNSPLILNKNSFEIEEPLLDKSVYISPNRYLEKKSNFSSFYPSEEEEEGKEESKEFILIKTKESKLEEIEDSEKEYVKADETNTQRPKKQMTNKQYFEIQQNKSPKKHDYQPLERSNSKFMQLIKKSLSYYFGVGSEPQTQDSSMDYDFGRDDDDELDEKTQSKVHSQTLTEVEKQFKHRAIFRFVFAILIPLAILAFFFGMYYFTKSEKKLCNSHTSTNHS